MKKIVTVLLVPAFILIMGASPATAAEKSRSTALFLSLVLPGAGQYYAGSPGSAKLFIAAELALWGGYYYNSTMKQSRRDDYLRYARQHAGVDPSGRGESFLGSIGAFNSSFDYNGYMLSMEANPVLYSGDTAWNWDSLSSRARFHSLRESELDYENTMKYFVTGVVLNHLIAGLHASNIIGRKNRTAAFIVTPTVRGLSAVYARSF